MKWSSDTFYKARLVADDSVKSRLLADLPGVVSNENTKVPLVLIDTSGCDMYELVTEDEQSKVNRNTLYPASLVVLIFKFYLLITNNNWSALNAPLKIYIFSKTHASN